MRGPIISSVSVRSFVHLFVRLMFVSELLRFMIFGIKVDSCERRKVREPVFSEKFLFGVKWVKWAKRAQNGPKMDFLDFCENWNHEMYGQIT